MRSLFREFKKKTRGSLFEDWGLVILVFYFWPVFTLWTLIVQISVYIAAMRTIKVHHLEDAPLRDSFFEIIKEKRIMLSVFTVISIAFWLLSAYFISEGNSDYLIGELIIAFAVICAFTCSTLSLILITVKLQHWIGVILSIFIFVFLSYLFYLAFGLFPGFIYRLFRFGI